MGATEEQMQLLSDAGVTHVAYIMILYSIAFILFLCMSIFFLLKVYADDHFKSSTFFSISTRSMRSRTRSLLVTAKVLDGHQAAWNRPVRHTAWSTEVSPACPTVMLALARTLSRSKMPKLLSCKASSLMRRMRPRTLRPKRRTKMERISSVRNNKYPRRSRTLTKDTDQ